MGDRGARQARKDQSSCCLQSAVSARRRGTRRTRCEPQHRRFHCGSSRDNGTLQLASGGGLSCTPSQLCSSCHSCLRRLLVGQRHAQRVPPPAAAQTPHHAAASREAAARWGSLQEGLQPCHLRQAWRVRLPCSTGGVNNVQLLAATGEQHMRGTQGIDLACQDIIMQGKVANSGARHHAKGPPLLASHLTRTAGWQTGWPGPQGPAPVPGTQRPAEHSAGAAMQAAAAVRRTAEVRGSNFMAVGRQ